MAEKDPKSEKTELWQLEISRNLKRRNDGKFPKILKDGMTENPRKS